MPEFSHIAGRYCDKLNRRAARLRTAHHVNLTVVCNSYKSTCPDAEVYIWWEEGPNLLNPDVLSHLKQLHSARRIRASAQAVLLFDHSLERAIQPQLHQLQPSIRWRVKISFDERARCLSKYGNTTAIPCSRAAGAFTIVGVPLATYQEAPRADRPHGGHGQLRGAKTHFKMIPGYPGSKVGNRVIPAVPHW
mmetsp:Transcript_84666/g.253917  ORF Transcript_84666/g.253917 Transcript_84666/m.253917 type:complete len:192 (-) Transcript_84666:201-776(-)